MYETHLTAVGTLITGIDRRRFADGTTKVHFRIACNERRFDRIQNGWTDGGTLYMSVNCWRDLAENVHASFVVGDPIIVRGRLLTREWQKDGKRQSITEVEASAVGPDLSRCTTRITRTKRGRSSADGSTDEGVDPAAGPAAARGAIGAGTLSDPTSSDAEARSGPSEDDPWQMGILDASEGTTADVEYDDGWPDEARSADRGAAVEAAVGA